MSITKGDTVELISSGHTGTVTFTEKGKYVVWVEMDNLKDIDGNKMEGLHAFASQSDIRLVAKKEQE